jgi:hypothetical protein
VQALDAVVVSQVENLVGVLILDFELRLQVAGKFGRGTHALCLALRRVTGEHATIAVRTPILVSSRQRGRFLAWLAQRMSRVSALCCSR